MSVPLLKYVSRAAPKSGAAASARVAAVVQSFRMGDMVELLNCNRGAIVITIFERLSTTTLLNDRDQIDLDQSAFRQLRDADGRPCRLRVAEVRGVDLVERGEVGEVGEVHGGFGDIAERRAAGGEHGREI